MTHIKLFILFIATFALSFGDIALAYSNGSASTVGQSDQTPSGYMYICEADTYRDHWHHLMGETKRIYRGIGTNNVYIEFQGEYYRVVKNTYNDPDVAGYPHFVNAKEYDIRWFMNLNNCKGSLKKWGFTPNYEP